MYKNSKCVLIILQDWGLREKKIKWKWKIKPWLQMLQDDDKFQFIPLQTPDLCEFNQMFPLCIKTHLYLKLNSYVLFCILYLTKSNNWQPHQKSMPALLIFISHIQSAWWLGACSLKPKCLGSTSTYTTYLVSWASDFSTWFPCLCPACTLTILSVLQSVFNAMIKGIKLKNNLHIFQTANGQTGVCTQCNILHPQKATNY